MYQKWDIPKAPRSLRSRLGQNIPGSEWGGRPRLRGTPSSCCKPTEASAAVPGDRPPSAIN